MLLRLLRVKLRVGVSELGQSAHIKKTSHAMKIQGTRERETSCESQAVVDKSSLPTWMRL